MKKLILMTMILFSITSAYAESDVPDTTKNGHGEAPTTCPAGDDSGRSTTAETPPAPAAPSTTGKEAMDAN